MKQLKYQSAEENSRGAAIRARLYSQEHSHRYTAGEKVKAQCALDLLHTAYAYAESYINYRKTFISIKLTGVIRRSKSLAQEALDIIQERGYTVIATPQGMVVRIPKA
jgi:hypothetical protein